MTAAGSAPAACTITGPPHARPDFQLLDRGGPERVPRPDTTSPCPEAPRQLADRRGLAHAVHPHDEDHVRARGGIDFERAAHRADDVQHRLPQRPEQRLEVAEFLRATLPRRPPRIFSVVSMPTSASDQPCLEFIEYRVVDLPARDQVREVVGEPRVAPIQLRPHAREEAGLLRCSLGRGLVGLLRLEAEQSHGTDQQGGARDCNDIEKEGRVRYPPFAPSVRRSRLLLHHRRVRDDHERTARLHGRGGELDRLGLPWATTSRSTCRAT